jgi:hypothetical protein
MRRRRFLRALAVTPAVPAALGQQPVPAPPAAETPPAAATERLEVSVADQAAEGVVRFFNPQQFAALRRLSDLLMPPQDGAPGACDCGAPEFLDFLLSVSPADRQQTYRAGLDALNSQSRKRFGKVFAEIDAAQGGELLQPLREPWTWDPPSDPLARLLRAAKADVRTATLNSREWNRAAAAAGRRAAGTGLYWYPLD